MMTTAMNLLPLSDRILIKRSAAAEMTKGGLYLADSAIKKPNDGTVVALGPGKLKEDGTRSDFFVKVGDRVLFFEFAAAEFEFDGEKFLMIREEDLMGVWK